MLAQTAEDIARKASTQDIPLPAAKWEWAAQQQHALLESRKYNPGKPSPRLYLNPSLPSQCGMRMITCGLASSIPVVPSSRCQERHRYKL